MRVLIATTHPSGSNVAYSKFLQCLEMAHEPNQSGVEWTTQGANADAALFIDNDYLSPDRLYRRVLQHPLARRFAGRRLLFSNTDWPAPYFPGIFPSLTPTDVGGGRACSSHYLSTAIPQIPAPYVEDSRRDWLYSFVGRISTSPVRARLMQLPHARGHCAEVTGAPETQTDVDTYRHHYWSVLAHSHFALCPRGYGSSSFRLFEAMQCGRAPVIISDAWVPPAGPDWSAFSVRIRENQMAELPEILGALEHRSVEMGQIARKAWETWFSDSSTPRTLAGYLQGLLPHASRSAELAWTARYLAAPRQLRSLASLALKRQG